MKNSAPTNKLTSFESLQGLRNDFRTLLETGQFADARVICYENAGNGEGGGERKRVEIPVHKAILSAYSKFFAKEFSGGKDEIEILDLSLGVVQAILSHIYCDKNQIAKMDDGELLELYKAAKLYGLDIFKTQKAQSKFVLKHTFPKKSAHISPNFRRTLSGETIKAFSMRWRNQLTMEMRGSQRGSFGGGGERMHMDFSLSPLYSRIDQKIFVVALSLSVQNSAGEKVKTVKREYFTRGVINLADCFDYSQLIRDNLFQQTSRRYRETQLVVLCEATVVAFKDDVLKIRCSKGIVFRMADKTDAFDVLLKSGRFSDSRIVCYGKSDEKKVVFATAFSIEMREAETGEVVVPPESGFSPATIRAMLSYIYTATIPSGLDQRALIALFKTAHFYQIEGLMELCGELMEITTENCCDTLLMADFYGEERLKAKALTFIRRNLNAVKTTEEWQNLMESAGEQLKMQLPLTVENCFELLTLADKWDGQIEARRLLLSRNK